jgi:hypothetical protein
MGINRKYMTRSSSKFIGTTDDVDVVERRNGVEVGRWGAGIFLGVSANNEAKDNTNLL